MIPLLTPEDVASQLQVSLKTLANWRSLLQGPKYLKVGGRVRYEPAAVEAFIAKQSSSNVTQFPARRSA